MRRIIVLLAFLVAPHALAYVVDDLGDAADATPGDGLCATAGAVCTLRAAIMEANATAGTQPITFSVAGTISPATAYPGIADPVNIDGTTAPGYAGTPVVTVDGAASVIIGFNFAAGSAGSSLQGLRVMGFSETAVTTSADNISIRRNHLGPVGGGTPNQDGVQLFGNGSTIGGADGNGNVISGNTRYGVLAAGSGHTISDNLIGTDAAGTAALANGEDGVHLFSNATNIVVGSLVAGEGNVISGNGDDGVHLDQTTSITIRGNFIGTDVTGTSPLGNGFSGVLIGASESVTVGGSSAAARNVISANSGPGVFFESGSENVVAANYIGLDATGTATLGNGGEGVLLSPDAPGNTIGIVGAGNVISGNSSSGIDTGGADDIIVRANIIGLDATGAAPLPNLFDGIAASDAANIDIGGLAAGEGNVISANDGAGIFFSFVEDSRILGNIIGLDAAGSAAFGNSSGGIELQLVMDVTVGSNTISANDFGGLAIFLGNTSVIENNRVGTNPAGNAPFGNLDTGILVVASFNVTVRGNVVGDNDGHGIEMTAGSIGTIVHSNFVGVSPDLTVAMPNLFDGVNVCDGAEDTVVGSVALGGNVIANNAENGIGVEPTALLNNTWAANSIFDNGGLGIDIEIDGVTANDPMDPDEGANALQNFPTPTKALTTPSASHIEGTINTTPSTAVALHFYSSPAADPSGFGEGQTYLGTTNVTTDASGDAAFVFSGPALTAGHFVTATATTASGTSEFSEAIAVTPAPTVQFASASFGAGEADGSATITVTRTGDLSVTSTVQYTTSDNTATAGADYTTAS
ncbi:MAG TPA: right-handed parallel beta-helix repeat-containing protein, partial [Thermoanaerobaculia bacterium]|nr:right-handed parallel beta-helix repeat-containing protein [Thermoanaerobaculia bacterium]